MDIRVYIALGFVALCLIAAVVAVILKVFKRNCDHRVYDSTPSLPKKITDFPQITVDPELIPEQLHPLIPFAERWGFSDDDLRIARIESASPGEKADVIAIVHSHAVPFRKWLEDTDVTQCPDHIALAFLDTAVTEIEAIEKGSNKGMKGIR